MIDRLIEQIVKTQNPTVAGLDPKLDYVPEFLKAQAFEKYGATLKGAAKALLNFNKGLIDELCDIVPAIKPQCAYYEMYGYHGVKALYKTIEYAKKRGMMVITDGKRNDIGTTMEAYAVAHLGRLELEGDMVEPFGADALTVNGYLGSDGIRPLLAVCKEYDKGIFVLVKTSNPSSGELQDRLIDGKTVYETMGAMCESWGEELRGKYGYSAVGAVVGATYPKQLSELREKMPHTFFLVPGYGAQGGTAASVAGMFDHDGSGAIVNSSRGIIGAWRADERYSEDLEPESALEIVAANARRAAEDMRDQLRVALA